VVQNVETSKSRNVKLGATAFMPHPYPLSASRTPKGSDSTAGGKRSDAPGEVGVFFRPCKGRSCALATAEEFDPFSVEIANPRTLSGGDVAAGRDLLPTFQDQPFRLTGHYGAKQLFSRPSTMGAERFTCG
jgi:hypothetical protein